jgi:hypothetical protein
MENKIKEEQLHTIVEQQKELNSFVSRIGLLETQKHNLLHQLSELNKTVDEFKVELFNEYGDVNINIEDGSYTNNKKPETVEEPSAQLVE